MDILSLAPKMFILMLYHDFAQDLFTTKADAHARLQQCRYVKQFISSTTFTISAFATMLFFSTHAMMIYRPIRWSMQIRRLNTSQQSALIFALRCEFRVYYNYASTFRLLFYLRWVFHFAFHRIAINEASHFVGATDAQIYTRRWCRWYVWYDTIDLLASAAPLRLSRRFSHRADA